MSLSKQICLLVLFFIMTALAAKGFNKLRLTTSSDTIFPGKALANASFISNAHTKFVLLIHARGTYASILYLDVDIKRKEDKLTVVQKLYNGKYTNTDSVIVNNQTLMPVESYSDINTSKDSFAYAANNIKGTMLARDGDKKGTLAKVDTTFSKPMFNGLIYAETYQALSYQKNHPFYVEDYVPGHNVKITRVEYIRDDEIVISGLRIPAKVLEMKTGSIVEYVWLNAKNQDLLKIEAKFPNFDYSELRLL